MDEALEWMKKHPYATGGILFVVLVIIYFLFFRGSTSSANNSAAAAQAAYYNAQAATAASGNSLLASQQQSQVYQNEINAQAATAAQESSAQVQVAQLEATTAQNSQNDQAAASVAIAQAQAQASETASTLTAQTDNATILGASYSKLLDNLSQYMAEPENQGQDILMQGTLGGQTFSASVANYEQEPYIIDPTTGQTLMRTVTGNQPANAGNTPIGTGGFYAAGNPIEFSYGPNAYTGGQNGLPPGTYPSSMLEHHGGNPLTEPMNA